MLRNRRKARASRASTSAGRGSALLYVLFAVLVIAGYVLFGVQADLALDLRHAGAGRDAGPGTAPSPRPVSSTHSPGSAGSPSSPSPRSRPQRDLATIPPTNETDDPTVGLIREYEIAPEPLGALRGPPLRGGGAVHRREPGRAPRRRRDVHGHQRQRSLGRRAARRGTSPRERGQPGARLDLAARQPRHGLRAAAPGPGARRGTEPPPEHRPRRHRDPPPRADAARRVGAVRRAGRRGDHRCRAFACRGDGGGGVVYGASTGSPSIDGSAEISGSPSTSAVPDYDGSIDGVFGVSVSALKSMADLSTTDAAAVAGAARRLHADRRRRRRDVRRGAPAARHGRRGRARRLHDRGRLELVLQRAALGGGRPDRPRALVPARHHPRPGPLRRARARAATTSEVDFDDGILGEILALMGQYRHTKAIHVHDQDQMLRSRSLEE